MFPNRNPISRYSIAILALAAIVAPNSLGNFAYAEDPPKPKERPDYDKLGKPFVEKYCAKCHS